MNNDTQKISAVLSDNTRFSVYKLVEESIEGTTAKEVSEKLSIHPNVARWHLTKLEDVNLITSVSDKNKSNGRPPSTYFLSNEVVTLKLPSLDYLLFSKILFQTISSSEFNSKMYNEMSIVFEKLGKDLSLKFVEDNSIFSKPLSDDERFEHLSVLSNAVGLRSHVVYENGVPKVKFHNCPYRELAVDNHLVCSLHQSFLKGLFEPFLKNSEFETSIHLFDNPEQSNVCTVNIM